MKRSMLIPILVLFFSLGHSQDTQPKEVFGDRYLEDQFYAGLGYNFLLNRPTDVVQNSLSYSIQLGFIKDIPLNKRRNFGMGLGLGYAADSYYSNIGANEVNGGISYEVLNGSDFVRSRFGTHSLEIPIELRWRTSTSDEYKFWRIYTGVKLGYVFSSRSKLVMEENTTKFSNADIDNFQYGLQLNFGYNTWNIHTYYGLTSLLKGDSALDTGESIDMGVLRIGIVFYIL